MRFENYIRTIPDFPKEGILFRDITPLLADGKAFGECIAALAQAFAKDAINKVVGVEARGFILGAAVAHKMGCGFVPVRKIGKLPFVRLTEHYDLEYGNDGIEIHRDALITTDRVLIVDDLIATGGTALASIRLIRKLGATIVGLASIIDLVDLQGADKIRSVDVRVFSLLQYAGE